MSVIELKNVTFSYSQDTPILKGINLSFEKGKFVSVVGHNGSGKSTLAKLLIGLLMPDEGEIFVNGELLTRKFIDSVGFSIVIGGSGLGLPFSQIVSPIEIVEHPAIETISP